MVANILKKLLNSLKKILSIIKFPAILTLITTFVLKIGHVINLTNSILSSSGIADKIADFFTNPKSWLDNSSISERFINAATIFASWLPENLIGKVAILWLNTKNYLRTNMPNQTTALIANLVFWGTTLIAVVRENFKTNALRGYFHRLEQEQKEPGSHTLTNEEINVFNVGMNSSNSLLSKLKTCFNKNAIFNPTAYYAGLKFASLPQNEKKSKVFTSLIKSNIDFSNLVNQYKLLSQEDRDNALYLFEKTSLLFITPLTSDELRKAAALLAAGANPNYLPPKNEYRSTFAEPCTLIASAMRMVDLDFFNLLLKYEADLLQESGASNEIIWNTYINSFHAAASQQDPVKITMINKILEKLETSHEEINEFRKSNPQIMISGKESFQTFVKEMKEIKEKSSISPLKV